MCVYIYMYTYIYIYIYIHMFFRLSIRNSPFPGIAVAARVAGDPSSHRTTKTGSSWMGT